VQFLGVTFSPQLCVITEYLDAGSLYDFLHSDKGLDANLIMNLVRGIAAGMLHLHSENIIHRDLAARNILIGRGFQIKITDFGLSRPTSEPSGNENKTKSNSGPLKWMAPESILKRVYNVYTDMWSFGVLLWEIVTKNEPYVGYDAVQAAIEVTKAESPLRLKVPNTAPILLQEIIPRCFELVPEKRPDFKTLSIRVQQSKLEEWMPPQEEPETQRSRRTSSVANKQEAVFVPTEYGAMPKFE